MVFVVLEHRHHDSSKIMATSFDEEHAKQLAYNSLDLAMAVFSHKERYWAPEEVAYTSAGQRYGVFRLVVDGADSGVEIQSWSTPLAGPGL